MRQLVPQLLGPGQLLGHLASVVRVGSPFETGRRTEIVRKMVELSGHVLLARGWARARRRRPHLVGGSLHPIDDFLSSPSWWFRFVLAFNIAAALGTLAGIVVLFRKRRPWAFPLAAGPVIFPFAYYLTLALPRYRHPIHATLLLLAAITLSGLFAPKRDRM